MPQSSLLSIFSLIFFSWDDFILLFILMFVTRIIWKRYFKSWSATKLKLESRVDKLKYVYYILHTLFILSFLFLTFYLKNGTSAGTINGIDINQFVWNSFVTIIVSWLLLLIIPAVLFFFLYQKKYRMYNAIDKWFDGSFKFIGLILLILCMIWIFWSLVFVLIDSWEDPYLLVVMNMHWFLFLIIIFFSFHFLNSSHVIWRNLFLKYIS